MFSSPLDLLTNSSDEQIITRCLIRTPKMSRAELAAKTKLPLDKLDSLLEGLLESKKVIQHGHNGHTTYSAHFASARRAPATNLLDSLFA